MALVSFDLFCTLHLQLFQLDNKHANLTLLQFYFLIIILNFVKNIFFTRKAIKIEIKRTVNSVNNHKMMLLMKAEGFKQLSSCCHSVFQQIPVVIKGLQSIKDQQRKIMDIKNQLKTLSIDLSSKTVAIRDHPNLKSQIKEYFLSTYAVYQKLFELLACDQAYYIRAEPLRHPLIFYFGHTAAVYVNKFIDHGVISQRLNPEFQKMFAVGVDQMDWDDLNQSHYDWPSVADTRVYRNRVKKMVLECIQASSTTIITNWLTDMWVVLMGIEHERIHLQTSAVIIRRVPLQLIRPVSEFVQCSLRQQKLEDIPNNQMIDVPAWKDTWQRRMEDAQTYGWDNQFGYKQFDVEAFKASQMLVSNGEYLQFVTRGGYNQPQYWTSEGQKWLLAMHPIKPPFWQIVGDDYKLRTLYQLINMPWDWPVEINNLQARAFCNWKTAETGHYTRLPTEDEYYSIRTALKKDLIDWKYQQVGNVNMEYWMSPNPVNLFKNGDFYDVLGNVWQHTITPIYPFKGFAIHPAYQDFTTPTFDERHDLIKGGSFISTGNQALYHARYAFRRHFYQFAGFRYIQTNIQMEVDLHSQEIISDKNVQMNLKHHYLNEKSYVLEVAKLISKVAGESAQQLRALTVGCSVGRLPLQFSKTFAESIGIDYTTRYFQMSTRLREKGFLKFKDIDIDLRTMKIQEDRVSLFQMNPQNPDVKKINNCDWIIVDGMNIRKGKIESVLKKIVKMAKKNAQIVLVNASGVNQLTREEGKVIIEKEVEGCVVSGEQVVLQASGEDQSYLTEWSNRIEFRVNFYEIIGE